MMFAGQAAFHKERMVTASIISHRCSFATENRVAMRSLGHPGVADCFAHSTVEIRVPSTARGFDLRAQLSAWKHDTMSCRLWYAPPPLPLTPPHAPSAKPKPVTASNSEPLTKACKKCKQISLL